jgi:hypothetical protein
VDADGIVYVDGFRLTRISISDISLVWAEIPELTASFSGPYIFAAQTSLDATFDSALQGFTAIGTPRFKCQAPYIHPDGSSMKNNLSDKADPADSHPRTGERKMTTEEMFCVIHTRQLDKSVPMTDRYLRIHSIVIICPYSREARDLLHDNLGRSLLIDFVAILMDPRNSHFVFRRIHHTQTNY